MHATAPSGARIRVRSWGNGPPVLLRCRRCNARSGRLIAVSGGPEPTAPGGCALLPGRHVRGWMAALAATALAVEHLLRTAW